MLIYSMSVSVDGFIADREGAFGWTTPNEEQFRFHITQTRELGGYLCGRRLYETMLVWETDPSLRDKELGAAFADVWCAIPKVVFSRTLDSVQGNARLAEASVAEEAAAALDATDKDVSIGGAGLAAAAVELGLVDELRMFRYPVVVGGGTPFLPPVTEDVPLDLIETRTFGSRVIYERYPARPRRLGLTPPTARSLDPPACPASGSACGTGPRRFVDMSSKRELSGQPPLTETARDKRRVGMRFPLLCGPSATHPRQPTACAEMGAGSGEHSGDPR